MVSFGSSFNIRERQWTAFKAELQLRGGRIQFEETPLLYQSYFTDGSEIFTCIIYKNSVPHNIQITYSQSQNDIDKADFLDNYFDMANSTVDDPSSNRTKMVEVNFRKGDIEQTTYFLLIDKDNPDGYYKHTDVVSGGIKISGMHSAILKNKIADAWTIRLGVVLSVDAEQCRIAWDAIGTLAARSAGASQETLQQFIYPLLIDCTVSNGELLNSINNHVEVVTSLNLNTPIEDASNIYRTVQPGDIILRPTLFSGSGSIIFHYHIWYLVE